MQNPFFYIFGGSMYSTTELRKLNIKPRINDISLKVLSEYYEMFLFPFIYHYHIKLTNEEKNISLKFDLEKFCHLLGIESIVKYSVPRNKLHNYRGKDGWDNISNSIIDIKHLKNVNRKKFNNVKAKYVYFYLLPELIQTPNAVSYDINKVDGGTNIQCEILFYSRVENDNAIIHLGIEKDIDGYYFPRTFFVEKVSEKEDDIYISNQENITVSVEKRVIML